MIEHNIYIHVPFCLSKCKYCAFFSAPCVEPDWESFTAGIVKEIDFWKEKIGQIQVPTVFFGGGTPSLLPEKNLDLILSHLKKEFILADNCEISLEANPGTITNDKLLNFKNIGINRLSIGVQSFDNERLAFLGRKHDSKAARNLIDFALNIGLRTSADFIYGLPCDTPDYVSSLCQGINKTGLQHCSMYELTIEPNTPFGKMNLDMPSNEAMAQMYETISEKLLLPRYEVSNYATAGQECRHNQNVWDGDAYIGLGKGAAGRPYINNQWYEQQGNFERLEPLSKTDRAIEKIITGLRQARGLKLTPDVRAQIDFEFVKQNPDLLIVNQNDRLSTTSKGMLVLDNLITELVK